MTLREIYARISEIGERIRDLSEQEVKEVSDDLKTLEDCKEKLFLIMFLNKKKKDGANWDLIGQMRKDAEKVMQRREVLRLVVTFQGSGSTHRPLVSATSGKRWLDVDWLLPFPSPIITYCVCVFLDLLFFSLISFFLFF